MVSTGSQLWTLDGWNSLPGWGIFLFSSFFPVIPFINKTLACTLIVPKADSSESSSWLAVCLSRAGGITRGNSCSIHFSLVACWKMLEDVLSTHINPNFFETTASSDASVRRSMIFSNSWLQRSKATSAASVPPSLQKKWIEKGWCKIWMQTMLPKICQNAWPKACCKRQVFYVNMSRYIVRTYIYMCIYADTDT